MHFIQYATCVLLQIALKMQQTRFCAEAPRIHLKHTCKKRGGGVCVIKKTDEKYAVLCYNIPCTVLILYLENLHSK